MKYLICLSLILLLKSASADEAYFKFGKAVSTETSSKFFTLGVQHSLPRGVILQSHLGVVNTPGFTTKMALHTGASLGLQVDMSDHFALQALWGPSFYSRKDEVLGGPFQFTHDLCAEGRDQNNLVGVCYQHISSAGIYKPNRGMDALQIKLGVRF